MCFEVYHSLATFTLKSNPFERPPLPTMTELNNETEGYMPYELIVEAADSPLINEYKIEPQRYLEPAKISTATEASKATTTSNKGKKQRP